MSKDEKYILHKKGNKTDTIIVDDLVFIFSFLFIFFILPLGVIKSQNFSFFNNFLIRRRHAIPVACIIARFSRLGLQTMAIAFALVNWDSCLSIGYRNIKVKKRQKCEEFIMLNNMVGKKHKKKRKSRLKVRKKI